jgi:hypothetical protein
MPVRAAFVVAFTLAACGAPASPAVGGAATLGPATAADVRDLRMEVSGLI